MWPAPLSAGFRLWRVPHPRLRMAAGLVAGLDPASPGLVPVTEWRPAPHDPHFEDVSPGYGILARKP